MRILIIRNYPNTMDVDKRSYNIQEIGLARALTKKGHVCDVVFWTAQSDYQRQIDCEGGVINVYYIHALNILKNGVFPKRLDDLCSGYDVIQLSEYNQFQAWKYAKKFKDRMVLLHGPYYCKFNKRYNLMCRLCDVLFLPRYKKLGTRFMVKSALAEQFLLKKGISQNNISKVYVGIDEQALRHDPNEEVPEFVKRVINEEQPVLLYVGKIENRRRSLFLLDVFRRVLDVNPNVRPVIVGDGDEKYLGGFCEHMRELNLDGQILWEKKLEQKYISHLYKKADVFLLPTEFDIFGMVLLEAMYFKTAVVTSQNGGSSTLIQSGTNGVCLNSFDSKLWADTVLDILSDGERRHAMEESAAKTVADSFTWDKICENYIECYLRKLRENKK